MSAARLDELERRITQAAAARDARAVAAGWRAVLDHFEAVSATRPDPEPAPGEGEYERLWKLAEKAMANLGGQSEPPLQTLADYDSDRYGPMLGVSDEGSATAAIRRGGFAAPKCAALGRCTPLTAGIAHDAERLGAVGEVAVGPEEFAKIRLASRGRVLTTTNIGTRVNVRLFLDPPQLRVSAGTADTAAAELAKIFAPYLKTPSGQARSLTVLVHFDSKLSTVQRRATLTRLQNIVAEGKICNPRRHRIGLLIDPGRGKERMIRARAGIDLAAGTGVREVAVDGLGDRFEPDELAELFKYSIGKKIELTRRERLDPQTTARHVWTGLSVARNMGLELGKYGLVPLTFEDQEAVIIRIQYWFPFWCAAPVYYIDYPLVTAKDVYHGPKLAAGIRLWLKMVAKHGVRVVLIDTANKSEGRKLLKDSASDSRGFLTSDDIAALTAFARERNVKVLWAGGITLSQAYALGKLGVFGIYVTSEAANLQPVGRKYRKDPFLVGLREPDEKKVGRVKLVLEAGFLVGRGATELESGIDDLLAAAAKDEARANRIQADLHPRVVQAWRKHFAPAR
jgi:hypothetical protein